jgi:hypothetical protein
MKPKDFTTSFKVDQSPEEVFNGSNAWGMLINGNLLKLITTGEVSQAHGKGLPNQKKMPWEQSQKTKEN